MEHINVIWPNPIVATQSGLAIVCMLQHQAKVAMPLWVVFYPSTIGTEFSIITNDINNSIGKKKRKLPSVRLSFINTEYLPGRYETLGYQSRVYSGLVNYTLFRGVITSLPHNCDLKKKASHSKQYLKWKPWFEKRIKTPHVHPKIENHEDKFG
jgi:hypothetical protein